MSYSVTSDGRDLSDYVQSLLAGTQGKTGSLSGLSSSGDGNAFSEALKKVSGQSSSGQLVLNSVISGTSLGSTQETQELSKRQGFDLLEKQGPDQGEWQKAFGRTEEETDGWSVLETLGSGLLTAAKIAGTILPFV